MTKLSVNINKIATLRNARGGNVPDVVKVALDCESLVQTVSLFILVPMNATFVVQMYMICALCCARNLISKVIPLRSLLTWC